MEGGRFRLATGSAAGTSTRNAWRQCWAGQVTNSLPDDGRTRTEFPQWGQRTIRTGTVISPPRSRSGRLADNHDVLNVLVRLHRYELLNPRQFGTDPQDVGDGHLFVFGPAGRDSHVARPQAQHPVPEKIVTELVNRHAPRVVGHGSSAEDHAMDHLAWPERPIGQAVEDKKRQKPNEQH